MAKYAERAILQYFLVSFMTIGLMEAQSYPVVVPVKKIFDIPDVGKANIFLNLQSQKGEALYKLQCHSTGYTDDPDFDYSGDFECCLSSIGHQDIYSTLLTERVNQDRDWESRGRFFSADLQGECAHIPEFGATRKFELRGMILTLHVVNPTFADEKLRALKLAVTVLPDSRAKRAIAKAVPFPVEPPSGCKLPQDFINPEPPKRISK